MDRLVVEIVRIYREDKNLFLVQFIALVAITAHVVWRSKRNDRRGEKSKEPREIGVCNQTQVSHGEKECLLFWVLPHDLLWKLWPRGRILDGCMTCKFLNKNLLKSCSSINLSLEKELMDESAYRWLSRFEGDVRLEVLWKREGEEQNKNRDVVLLLTHAMSMGWKGPTDLHIVHCKWTPLDVGSLAEVFNVLPWGLKTLNLSHNLVRDDGAQALASTMHLCRKLSSVSLAGCEIQALGAWYLSSAFPRLTELSKIALGFNRIEEGVMFIAQCAPNCPSLTHLDLTHLEQHFNRGGGMLASEAQILAASLPLCTSLKHLNISHNAIGFSGCKHILEHCRACTSLVSLDIRGIGAQLDRDPRGAQLREELTGLIGRTHCQVIM